MGQLGLRARFFRFRQYCHSKHEAWMQARVDASQSTGKKGWCCISTGGGNPASEGMVVGMVPGLADAHGWTSVRHYFVLGLVKGNSPHEVSLCVFHIFCDSQPEIPSFWNTAGFSNVAPVQLYLGILQCRDEGSRYEQNKWGKSCD